MKALKIIFLFCLMSLAFDGFSQQPEQLSTDSYRAKRSFNKALEAYRLRDISSAITELKRAVGFDPRFIEAYVMLGEVYHSEGEYQKSIEPYENALEVDADFFPPAWFFLAEAYLFSGEYAQARQRFLRFLEYQEISSSLKEKSEVHLENIDFALQALENPVAFDPYNLGDAINSNFSEYSPSLTTDEQTLVFTRKQPRDDPRMMIHGKEHENFYVSYWNNGQWTAARDMGPPVNTAGNEGAQSLSADGRHLFFTACNRPDGLGSCDIYYSFKRGNNWSVPVNLGSRVNSSAWDSQPSISPDGRTLYFASARKGGQGNMDIWYTTLDEQGQWEVPQNLGPVINTSGNETSPFIHADNTTLYFSSDGHRGMGGLDLFVSRRQKDDGWSEPANIGFPVNTFADEFSLIVNSSGSKAYFSSGHLQGKGEMDIYSFELPVPSRPDPVTYMKGKVFDIDDKTPLEAYFELIDLEANNTVIQSRSDAVSGEFLVAIPTGKQIALNVSKPGYLFFSESFSYELRHDAEPYLRDIPLKTVRQGETVVLRNIFFDHDSYQLKPQSVAELQKLVRLLRENPGMKIQINGHTDSTGSADYNLVLSENRAKSVYEFLLGQDIDSSRLSYKGFGDTVPVGSNETEEGRARNRRTEFEIVELNQ